MAGNSHMECATQKLTDGAADLRDAVMESAADSVEECCSQTQTMIKENPYRAVLTAFGIGAIFGMILLRR